MNPFQQLLNAVRSGYRKADAATGGWLPGGGIPSPAIPVIKKIPKSPIYTTIRDSVVVPLLDTGMQKGFIPGSSGMFMRYLSGTSKPLTVVPKDVKEAEAVRAQAMVDPQNYISSDNLAYQPSTERIAKEEALTNTLGQYTKTKGIILDRYDFNNYVMPGAFTAGVEGLTGENSETQKFTDLAGRFADKLGFITPSSGYDIRFNVPTKTNPLIEAWKKTSDQLRIQLQNNEEEITPNMVELSKKESELRNKIERQGLRIPSI